jgi:hypothetical protein
MGPMGVRHDHAVIILQSLRIQRVPRFRVISTLSLWKLNWERNKLVIIVSGYVAIEGAKNNTPHWCLSPEWAWRSRGISYSRAIWSCRSPVLIAQNTPNR